MNLLTSEEIALSEFKNVGDDGLFPNHSDKEIWISGFKSGYEYIKDLEDFFSQMVEDYHLWDESEKGPYPMDRTLSAMDKYLQYRRQTQNITIN